MTASIIENFDYSEATSETLQKATDIIDRKGVKYIEKNVYVVAGGNDYEVTVDETEKTVICQCQGYEHHTYCKHSIALAMYIDTNGHENKGDVTMEDLKPIQKMKKIVISKDDQQKMELLAKQQDESKVILKKSIPVLAINFDMYLPVSFGEYVEVNGELDTILQAIKSNLPFLIEGDKGIGKTLAVNTVCVRDGIPEVAYSCSSGTTMGDILGKEHLLGNDSVFELGLLPTAIEVANHFGKGILYLDELNALEPEIQKMLNPVIDARQSITVNGHTYRLHKDVIFNIVATMNPSTYAGTSPLNEDLRSRFIGEVWKYPSASQLATIIDWTGIPPKKVQRAVLQLAMDTLGMKQKGELDYVLSTRDLDLFAKAYRAWKQIGYKDDELTKKTIQTAILIKFGDAQDRDAVRIRANESFGVEIKNE